MPKVAIVAALEREVGRLLKSCRRLDQSYSGRSFAFFECPAMVVVCGGIGTEAARRAAEAVIALYHPTLLLSAGFAGALDAGLHVGDVFEPAVVIDARYGSRIEVDVFARSAAIRERQQAQATLVTFMEVAGVEQKASLAQAYAAQAVDMEAAAVAAAAHAHHVGFAAIKVISDEVDFEMPPTSRFVTADGRFQTAKFAAFLALRPALWSRVATLAGNSRTAARALGEHLERYRQELSRTSSQNLRQESDRESDNIAAPAPPAPPAAVAGASKAGGHE